MKLVDHLILTPMLEEWTYARPVLTDSFEVREVQPATSAYCLWRHGHHPEARLAVGTFMWVKTPAQPKAGASTAEAIHVWQPAELILLGICGSLDPDRLHLGDVVIPMEVLGFTSEAVDGGHRLLRRTPVHIPSESVQAAGAFKASADYLAWREECAADAKRLGLVLHDGRLPELHLGEILGSGNTVVRDAQFAKILRSQIGEDISCIAMEEVGAAEAIEHMERASRLLVVRGVSDHADANKQELERTSQDAWRKFAARNAARAVRKMLDRCGGSARCRPLKLTPAILRPDGHDQNSRRLLNISPVLRAKAPTLEAVLAVRVEYDGGLLETPPVQCVVQREASKTVFELDDSSEIRIARETRDFALSVALALRDGAKRIELDVSDAFGRSHSASLTDAELGVSPVRETRQNQTLDFIGTHSLEDGFLGREEHLAQIHASLAGRSGASGGRVIISGMAGTGKTQLAGEYAHRFKNYYPEGIFWVEVANRDILEVLAELARQAGVDPPAAEEEILRFWNAFRCQGARLVVFDAVPERDPDQPGQAYRILRWLPRAGPIFAILTSRRRIDDSISQIIELDPLSLGAAYRLLTRGRKVTGRSEKRAALDICRELGRLPLALEIARAFIAMMPGMDHRTYHRDIQRTGLIDTLGVSESVLIDELPTGHEPRILEALERSWDICPPLGQFTLALCSWLAEVVIPLALIDHAVRNAFADLGPPAQAFANLTQLSLARKTRGGFVVHRLLAAFVRTKMRETEEGTLTLLKGSVAETFRAAASEDRDPLIPHLELLAKTENASDPPLAALIYRYYRDKGLFVRALHWARKNKLMLDAMDPSHQSPTWAAAARRVAHAMLSGGRATEETVELLTQALAVHRAQHVTAHVVAALTERGMAYEELQRPEAAIADHREAVRLEQIRVGPDGEDLIIPLTNLGTCLAKVEGPKAAIKIHTRALRIAKKHYRVAHEQLAKNYHNLGFDLIRRDWKKWGLAFVRKGYELARDALGATHPTVRAHAGMLASELTEQKIYSQALDILHETGAGNSAHETTSAEEKANCALGYVLYELGRYSEAEPYSRRALKMIRELREPKSEDVLVHVMNLAAVLVELKQDDEALELYREARNIALEHFDRNPKSSGSAVARYALHLEHLGRIGEAFSELERILLPSADGPVLSESMDRGEVETLLCIAAGLLQDEKRHREELPLLERALALVRELEPMSSERIGIHEAKLARCLCDNARWSEAIPHAEEAVRLLEASLGENDETTVKAKTTLARARRGDEA